MAVFRVASTINESPFIVLSVRRCFGDLGELIVTLVVFRPFVHDRNN